MLRLPINFATEHLRAQFPHVGVAVHQGIPGPEVPDFGPNTWLLENK